MATLKDLTAQGSIPAQIDLADAYRRGLAGPRDLSAAEEWLRRAAESGSKQALHELGHLYLQMGQYARAYAAFSSADARGYSPAKSMLAEMYIKGMPVKKDIDRAIELLEQAAAQGHSYAKGRLAQLYFHGLHVQKHQCFLCGLMHPRHFAKGVGLWLSAMRDALFCDETDERVQR